MSTEIDVRFCLPSTDRTAAEAFAALADAVARQAAAGPVFRNLRVSRPGRLDALHLDRDEMGLDVLVAAAKRWDAPDLAISARTTIACSNRDANGADGPERQFPLWIESRGADHVGRTGDRWIDGDARLSVGSVNPFVLPMSADGTIADDPAAFENLARLRNVVNAAIEALQPDAAKVYTDAGEFFPFNAHCAYFAHAEMVHRDLRLIAELFRAGHKVLEIPPVGDIDGDLAAFVFHLWRSSVGRDEIQRELGDAVAHDVRTSDDDVLEAASMFVVDQLDAGFVVESGPALFNGFIDLFYRLALSARG